MQYSKARTRSVGRLDFSAVSGWEKPPYGHNTNHLDNLITDDYQDFIATNKLRLFGAITGYFENATGQHAVEFTAFPPNENATWTYILIYDKQNKRIKIMQYGYTRFQS